MNHNWNNVNHWHPGWYNHYYGYHSNWYRGSWPYWNRYPVYWGAASAGWLGYNSGSTYVYSNPYYVQSTTAPVDYSQLLPVPAGSTSQTTDTASGTFDQSSSDQQTAEDPQTQQAVSLFDQAREAFKQGDYAKALTLDDQAIKELPGDPVLHELRGITLFAQKKYQDAASVIYSVLAVGPGCNWDTMKALYPDVQTYTNQLRALEDFVKKNPQAAYGHFLAAYQYLVLGYKDQAIHQLEDVVKLQPNDQLSAQLLKGLKEAEPAKPTVGN